MTMWRTLYSLLIYALIIAFLLEWGYPVYFELTDGATPGKRLLSLRVVQHDGSPLTLSAALLRNLVRFLTGGDKAKVTLRFRGREMVHQELGVEVLNRVQADLSEIAVVEQMPKLEGRQMVMILTPR